MKISIDDPLFNLDPTSAELDRALSNQPTRQRALFLRKSAALRGLDESKKSELAERVRELGGQITEENAGELEELLAAYAPVQ